MKSFLWREMFGRVMNSIAGQRKCSSDWRANKSNVLSYRRRLSLYLSLQATPIFCEHQPRFSTVCLRLSDNVYEKITKDSNIKNIENLYSQNGRQNSLTIFLLVLWLSSWNNVFLPPERRKNGKTAPKEKRSSGRRKIFFLENEKKAKCGRTTRRQVREQRRCLYVTTASAASSAAETEYGYKMEGEREHCVCKSIVDKKNQKRMLKWLNNNNNKEWSYTLAGKAERRAHSKDVNGWRDRLCCCDQ